MVNVEVVAWEPVVVHCMNHVVQSFVLVLASPAGQSVAAYDVTAAARRLQAVSAVYSLIVAFVVVGTSVQMAGVFVVGAWPVPATCSRSALMLLLLLLLRVPARKEHTIYQSCKHVQVDFPSLIALPLTF